MSDTTPTFDVEAIRKQAQAQVDALPGQILELQKRRDEIEREIKRKKADLAAAKTMAGRQKKVTP